MIDELQTFSINGGRGWFGEFGFWRLKKRTPRHFGALTHQKVLRNGGGAVKRKARNAQCFFPVKIPKRSCVALSPMLLFPCRKQSHSTPWTPFESPSASPIKSSSVTSTESKTMKSLIVRFRTKSPRLALNSTRFPIAFKFTAHNSSGKHKKDLARVRSPCYSLPVRKPLKTMITKPTLKTKITAIAKFEIVDALYDVKPREINVGDKLEPRNMRINTAKNTFFYLDYYGNRATKDIDFANIKLTY